MQTPDTEAGRLTETIMAGVKRRVPEIKTHEYNRIYEAVLEGLMQHDAAKETLLGLINEEHKRRYGR